jgi:hypothetical protein
MLYCIFLGFQIRIGAACIGELLDLSAKSVASDIFATIQFFLEANVIPGC